MPTPTHTWSWQAQPRTATPNGTPKAAPTRIGHSRLQCRASRNFHTETPCTTRPNAMIKVAVCNGERT